MQPTRWHRYPRTLQGAWQAIDDIRDRIDGMAIADEVAERVKGEIESHHMISLTPFAKVVAAIFAAAPIVDVVVQIVRVTHH
jgi:hypothetical protein